MKTFKLNELSEQSKYLAINEQYSFLNNLPRYEEPEIEEVIDSLQDMLFSEDGKIVSYIK